MSIAADFHPVGTRFEDVYDQLRLARKERPIFYSEELQGWVVTRYDDIVELLDNPVFTVEGTLTGVNSDPEALAILSTGINWNETAHIAGVEGKEHERLKKILIPVLAPKRIRKFEPTIRGIANELIDGFIGQGECEFVNEFCYTLPILSIFKYIGFNDTEDDLRKLAEWSLNTFKMWLTPMGPEEQRVCARDSVDYQAYIRAKMNDRRQSPRSDLMTEMVNAMDGGEMDITEDELVLMFIFTFIGAGHETTMAQIGNNMYQLLREPERWQYVLDHPEHIDDVVEEGIRYDGSVISWYRRAAKDIDFKGFPVKEGDFVIAAFGSGNHDECKYDNSESFCPVRPNRERPLTFSKGRHFCLGAPLARLEAKIAIEEIALRIPGIRLKPDQEIPLIPSVATRAIEKMELEW